MSEQFRIEKDFLGERQVPIDAYYGVQTLRAIENFPITGYRIHPALIRAMAMVKKAVPELAPLVQAKIEALIRSRGLRLE